MRLPPGSTQHGYAWETMKPVTLITGATGGIGRELAHLLAPTHELILTGQDLARLDSLGAELGARTLVLDLARPETFAAALGDLERLTNLIHCAGVVELGTLSEQTHSIWQHTLAVNTVAPAELTRLLLPQLRAQQGQVIFVNSGAGQVAHPGWSSYAASKFALRALADALRAEESPHGVRVTSVYPGRTATPMQERVREQEGGEYQPQLYAAASSVASAIAFALTLPPDAVIGDLSVRPQGGR